MKKVLSLTLATLAAAALSFSAQAHRHDHHHGDHAPSYEQYGHHHHHHAHSCDNCYGNPSFWVVKLKGGWGTPNDDYSAYALSTSGAIGTPYSHDSGYDFGGGGSLSYRCGDVDYTVEYSGFDMTNFEAITASTPNLGTVTYPVGVLVMNTLAPVNAFSNGTDTIDSRKDDNQKRFTLTRGVTLKFSEHGPFSADWKAGFIYLEGERNLQTTTTNTPLVPGTIAAVRDTVWEKFDGYGIVVGFSAHAVPFCEAGCIGFHANVDFAMVYSDVDFSYLVQTAANAGGNGGLAAWGTANAYSNSMETLLANTAAELSMTYTRPFGHTNVVFGVYTRGEVTFDARRTGAISRVLINAPGSYNMARFESGLSVQLELRR